MNRRKYISSLIGFGAISGLTYNYSSRPTIASEIKFDDEVRIVADFNEQETKEFPLKISIDSFTIQPKNIGNNVELEDIRVRGKTNTTSFGKEKSVYDSSNIKLSNNEEVSNILDDTNLLYLLSLRKIVND